MSRSFLFGLLALSTASGAVAQGPTVVFRPVECIPAQGHTLVAVAVTPSVTAAEPRVYFRRQDHGDFYYVPLQRASEGAFWGLLPIPEPENTVAELFAAVADAEGALVSRSAAQIVPVTSDCRVELEGEQRDLAGRLTVGETAVAQAGRELAWWRCEGVVGRIDLRGEERADEACAPVALWWQRPEMLAPLVLGWGGGVLAILIDEEGERELSPARP
jgi:hypothetical protein